MHFTEIFIRRPVLSTVVAALILFVGLVSVMNLSVREYPEVDETVITITTTYAGADPELIQGFITAPISKAVATTEHLDYVTSSSQPSVSVVSVNMELGSDPDIALTEVMSNVQAVRRNLPPDADDPVIVKGSGRTFALMYFAAQNPHMTREQLTEYLDRVIRPRMTNISGVAQMEILGEAKYTMRIKPDPMKMSARGVTAADLLAAIKASNFLSAPGKTENEFFAYALKLDSTVQSAEAFGALPLVQGENGTVRLRDVAEVEMTSAPDQPIVTFAGEPGTFIGIIAAAGENQLSVAQNVLDAMPAISNSLPEDMKITMVYDSTETIGASINEVFKTIAEAVVIVVVVILLFLGSFRSVVMPIATIPLSLIGVASIMLALGYSINLLTLLAMVLAIGLVVDDAIVVVENIHRHISEGVKPARAAIIGMQEITGPIIAMTITLAAVLSPLAFTGGLTGVLFTEFALTLAGSVIISGIVALTITPVMSAGLLRGGEPGRFQRIVDNSLEKVSDWYERRVDSSLDYWPVTLLVVLTFVGATIFMFPNTSSELAPEEDQGALFAILNGPRYATLEYTDAFTKEITKRTQHIEEVKTSFSVVGSGGSGSSGFYIWSLKDWGDRSRSQAEIQTEIQGILNNAPGLQGYAFSPPTLPGAGGGLPVSLVVQSIHSPDRVYEIGEEIKNRAMKSGQFIVVQNSLAFDAPQVEIRIDRDRAAELGVSVAEIGNTLGLLVGGGRVAQFDRDSNSYDIIPQVPRAWRFNPEQLLDFFVRSASGEMVPLSSVVTLHPQVTAAQIEQFNQLNSTTLQAMPMVGMASGDGLAALEKIANEVMPDGFFLDYADQSRLEKKEGDAIMLAFGAAIVVIYLVLAAQFESFRDPFIIMMAVPLTIFGAMLPLYFGMSTLNIYTRVGLITLIGLITKHGILMVEFANQQRKDHGLTRRQAIVKGARIRMRPILMTTAAMALAVVPLIFASGAGAAARFSMGLVIFMGLLIGTSFTLFVVPMFYSLISRSDQSYATHKQDVDRKFSTA